MRLLHLVGSTLVVWIGICSVCAAGVITGPDSIQSGRTIILKVDRSLVGETFAWSIQPQDASSQSFQAENRNELAVIIPDREALTYVSFAGIGPNGELVHDLKVIAIEGKPEPGPGPTPDPDDPDPPPGPAPIPEPGFRVLIVYESSDMTKYPIETQMILAGVDVREFLKKNCVVPPGGVAAYRIYDADIDVSNDSETWQKAMARPRTETPWVIISNGTTGYEGPLPKTPTEFLELCKRYLPTK